MGIFDGVKVGPDFKRLMRLQIRNFVELLKGLLDEKGEMTLSDAIKLLEDRLVELENSD